MCPLFPSLASTLLLSLLRFCEHVTIRKQFSKTRYPYIVVKHGIPSLPVPNPVLKSKVEDSNCTYHQRQVKCIIAYL